MTITCRILSSCFVLALAAAALAIPARAEAQYLPTQAAPARRPLTAAEIRLQQLVNQLNQQVAARAAQVRLQQLVNELNRQVAVARAQAEAGTTRPIAGSPGIVGGFSLGTPNINPLTVDSIRADEIRNRPGALGQATSLANMLGTQSINNGVGITLGRYTYRRRY